jgi:hypothetical protein
MVYEASEVPCESTLPLALLYIIHNREYRKTTQRLLRARATLSLENDI